LYFPLSETILTTYIPFAKSPAFSCINPSLKVENDLTIVPDAERIEMSILFPKSWLNFNLNSLTAI